MSHNCAIIVWRCRLPLSALYGEDNVRRQQSGEFFVDCSCTQMSQHHYRPLFAPSPTENAQWFSSPNYQPFPVNNMYRPSTFNSYNGYIETQNPYLTPSQDNASFFSPAREWSLSPIQTPHPPMYMQSPHQISAPTPVLLASYQPPIPTQLEHAHNPVPVLPSVPSLDSQAGDREPAVDRISFAPEAPQALTQAEHHPDLPTQLPAHPRDKKKLTEQQKNARKLASHARQQQSEALSEAIFAFLQKQEEQIEELARNHNVKVDLIRTQIQHFSKLRRMDRPSLFQAAVHQLGEDLNAGM